MTKKLESGAGVPNDNNFAEVVAALNDVAEAHGVDPAAIAGVIHMESIWNTRCVTGQYIGLTQVGPEFLDRKMDITKEEFLDLSAAEQIRAYGLWLDYFRFTHQMAEHGIDLDAMPLARQAALLQAMQFSPNGTRWKAALARGDFSKKSTESPQARALGDTSIGVMEAYYAGFFSDSIHPNHEPKYALLVAQVPRRALP